MTPTELTNLLNSDDRISIFPGTTDMLDFTIEQKATSIVRDLIGEVCPHCGDSLITPGHALLKLKNELNLRGVEIICKECNEKWYIHYPPKVPSLSDMEIHNV